MTNNNDWRQKIKLTKYANVASTFNIVQFCCFVIVTLFNPRVWLCHEWLWFHRRGFSNNSFTRAGPLQIALQEMTATPRTSASWRTDCQLESRDLDVYNNEKTLAIVNTTTVPTIANYLYRGCELHIHQACCEGEPKDAVLGLLSNAVNITWPRVTDGRFGLVSGNRVRRRFCHSDLNSGR